MTTSVDSLTIQDYLHYCRRVRRMTRDLDDVVLSNALEGLLIDEVVLGESGSVGSEGLVDLALLVQSRNDFGSDIGIVCGELLRRLGVSGEVVEAGDNHDDSAKEKRRQYKREWMRRKRGGD